MPAPSSKKDEDPEIHAAMIVQCCARRMIARRVVRKLLAQRSQRLRHMGIAASTFAKKVSPTTPRQGTVSPPPSIGATPSLNNSGAAVGSLNVSTSSATSSSAYKYTPSPAALAAEARVRELLGGMTLLEHEAAKLVQAAYRRHRVVRRSEHRTVSPERSSSPAGMNGHSQITAAVTTASKNKRPQQEASAFHQAIAAGDVIAVRAQLNAGKDRNQPMAVDEPPPLFAAAMAGNSEIIKVLVAEGCNPKHRQPGGSSALHAAATAGQSAGVGALVELGAELDAVNTQGQTALHLATAGGHEPVVSVLLRLGANARLEDLHGNTPLYTATNAAQLECVHTLLSIRQRRRGSGTIGGGSHGEALSVDVDAVHSIHGTTALGAAAEKGSVAIARRLLRAGADVDHIDNNGLTPLMLAAHEGHDGVAATLLDAGADVSRSVGKDGTTALMIAAEAGHTAVLQQLLRRGANINYTTPEGGAAVAYAAKGGHDAAVTLLLDNGANTAMTSSRGWAALHFAAHEGHTSTVQTLLKFGAKPNQPTIDGASPLHFAAQYGHVRTMGALLDGGADVDHACYDGTTALVAAIRVQSRQDTLEYLLTRAAADPLVTLSKGWSPLTVAADVGNDIALAALLQPPTALHPDVCRNSDGRTALIIAAIAGHATTVKRLLDSGAAADAAGRDGWTALMFAAKNGSVPIVTLLLDKKADTGAAAVVDDWTALGVAAEHGHAEVIEMLLKRGNADPNQRTGSNSGTALFVAALYGHTNAAQALLANGAEPGLADKEGTTPLAAAISHAAEHQDSTSEQLSVSRDRTEVDLQPQKTLADFSTLVDALLSRGADPNDIAADGSPVLAVAASSGLSDIVASLLRAGASIEETSESGWTALHHASAVGAANAATSLLERGANANAVDDGGATPLMALIYGEASANPDAAQATVAALVTNGADANATDADGVSVVGHAVLAGATDILEQVLAAGGDANPGTITKDGPFGGTTVDVVSPLLLAVDQGDSGAVAVLLRHGADPTLAKRLPAELCVASSSDGKCAAAAEASPPRNAFVAAAELKDDVVISALLEANASLPQPALLDQSGEGGADITISATQTAIASGNIGALRALLRYGADPLAALFAAADLGNEEALSCVLQQTANGDRRRRELILGSANDGGLTALGLAASHGNTAALKKLLDAGANAAQRQGEDGNATSLTLAAEAGREAATQLLLDRGANVNEARRDGWTPLMLALWAEDDATASLLLKRGADPQTPLPAGGTPLMMAAKVGSISLLHQLLATESGKATLESVDNNGWTALLYAARAGCEAAVRLLIERGANVEALSSDGLGALSLACMGDDSVGSPLVRTLLRLRGTSSQLNAQDSNGWTPAMHAAHAGNADVIRALLDAGADPLVRPQDAYHVLGAAATGARAIPVLEVLIETKRVPIDLLDGAGRTALMFAASAGRTAAVEWLLLRGSAPELCAKDGSTARHFALEGGHSDILQILL